MYLAEILVDVEMRLASNWNATGQRDKSSSSVLGVVKPRCMDVILWTVHSTTVELHNKV